MKLSLVALAALAGAVGVTPVAAAQTSQADAATPAAPELSSGLQPVSHVEARYPFRERRDRAEGQCTVLFDVDQRGSVENVRTSECTSRDFEREARRIAQSLQYPAEDMPREGVRDQSFTVRWEGAGVEG